jgi:hypothetical protein
MPPVPAEQDAAAARGLAPSKRAGTQLPTSTVSQRQGNRRSGDDDDLVPRLPVYIRFADLVASHIVSNWVQLGRLIDHEGFPEGVLLGPNTRAWKLDEVQAWLATRPTARKIPPPKRRGRPSKPGVTPEQ